MIQSTAALEIILRAKDEASRSLGSVGDAAQGAGGRIKSLAGGALKIGAGAIAGVGAAALGAGVALGKLAMDAAPIQGIRASFEALNEDASKTLDTLREGSLGMVTDAELMRNYNDAVQLVGKQFADELPDAMQYLGKVSASTGKDMSFLMDSLTTGVGRLSPMILDNLGITVNLTEANEAWAEANGRTVDSMTKQEQQAALMAQVIDKLNENTADLPDITDNATTSMAQLKTQFENVKNGIGEAMLPALSALLKPIGDLAQRYGPEIIAWAQKAGEWLGQNIPIAIERASEFWTNKLKPALEAVWSFISQNVIPILQTIAGWFQGDGSSSIGGFADKIKQFLGPALEFAREQFGWLVDWVRENWPLIKKTIETVLKAVKQVVEAVLGAIRAFWEQHGERIMAVVHNVWEIISTVFETTLRNIFDVVKVFMQLITGDTEGAMETLRGIWDRSAEAIKTIVGNLWENIKLSFQMGLDTIKGLWDAAMNWFRDIGHNIVEGIKAGIGAGWEAFKGWLRGKIEELIGGVLEALGIGSPSKVFEQMGYAMMDGLRLGIQKNTDMPALALQTAMGDMAPVLGRGRGAQQPGIGPIAPGLGGGFGSGVVVNNYFGRDSVRSDEDIEIIARRIEEVLAHRGVRELMV